MATHGIITKHLVAVHGTKGCIMALLRNAAESCDSTTLECTLNSHQSQMPPQVMASSQTSKHHP